MLHQLLARTVREVERLLPRQPRIRERRLCVDEILEAQHQRQRVVEFRGALVQHGAQLVVGEEWAIRLERIHPPQRLQRGLRLPFNLRDYLLRVEIGLCIPRAAHRGATAALQQELGLNGGRVRPSIAPRRSWTSRSRFARR